jgi:hypothetical protein
MPSGAPPPPPIPLAGHTPPDGSPNPMPLGPDQPLTLTTDQLTKLGMTDLTPGQSLIISAKVMIGGTPDAPTAQIVAAGDAQPDDGSSDLTPLSDDAAAPPGDGGLPISTDAPPAPGDDGSGPPPPGTMAPGSDDEEKVLGFKRSPKRGKTISAKDALGD